MKTYHQTGHNFIWNIQSLTDDDSGEGLILSPVNMDSEKIEEKISPQVLDVSWLDPQFYIPNDAKRHLATYDFFPGNLPGGFSTGDFADHSLDVATRCLDFQSGLGLDYLVIPVRYLDDIPGNYLTQMQELFVEPFLEAYKTLGLEKPILLTLIPKSLHLEPGIERDDLLSWATSFSEVGGIYVIFDNDFYSKQIKSPDYLAGALRFIRALRQNSLEVHVGYCGLEGILYAAADATSVSMGSYENLRSFATHRLESRERGVQRGPRPRIYSGMLLQWLDDTAIPPMRELVGNWRDYFDDSPYKDFLLDADSSLNFQRSEIYKHYFFLFSRQIHSVPELSERVSHIRGLATKAMELFAEISNQGVFLDPDSDGSHLPAWMNALSMFERNPDGV